MILTLGVLLLVLQELDVVLTGVGVAHGHAQPHLALARHCAAVLPPLEVPHTDLAPAHRPRRAVAVVVPHHVRQPRPVLPVPALHPVAACFRCLLRLQTFMTDFLSRRRLLAIIIFMPFFR